MENNKNQYQHIDEYHAHPLNPDPNGRLLKQASELEVEIRENLNDAIRKGVIEMIPMRKSKHFRESALAHELLDGLVGLQIGGSAHNDFGLRCLNVDYCGNMNTVFKKHEVELCGEALPVDIVAPGDSIPVPDKSFDFVISSHVIEHFFDPIGAIKEWVRISRKYVYIICPLRDALPSDVDKPLTPVKELFLRHEGRISAPEVDTHEHYTRWTIDSFCDMCKRAGFCVTHTQDTDDKVGNGFTVVIDTTLLPSNIK